MRDSGVRYTINLDDSMDGAAGVEEGEGMRDDMYLRRAGMKRIGSVGGSSMSKMVLALRNILVRDVSFTLRQSCSQWIDRNDPFRSD